MTASQTAAALVLAIETRALPWADDNDNNRIVTARANYKAMLAAGGLPDGAELTPRRLLSRRQLVRDRPGGFQFVSARWPADGLETKCFPMVACTLRGSAQLRMGDYVLNCREGQFVLIPVGVPHPDSSRVHLESENEGHRSCDILWFAPVGEALRCWICRSEDGTHTSMPTLYLSQKNLMGYCDSLFDEASHSGPVSLKISQALLMVLLASIQKEIQLGRFFRWLPQTVALGEGEEGDPIKRARNYIRQNIGDPLTLARVARYAHMSRSQFARKFHEETGETFVMFLTRCRLEEAKMRLTTTSVQIAGLSRHVGLQPRRFTELFQQHTGLTPSAYRRKFTTPQGGSADP